MAKKILMYGHGGAYNHGAEAIVKTTIVEMKKRQLRQEIFLSTHFKEQDEEYKLPVDKYLERDVLFVDKEKKEQCVGKYNLNIYQSTLNEIDKNTIGLSVGGDNYCYSAWHRWRDIHKWFKEKDAVDVLWSCSIDRECLTEEMLKTLKSHALITAREELTYQALVEKGLNNVVRCADVAFLMEAEEVDLPEGFKKENTVALNISPLVLRREKKKGIILEAVYQVIDYILEQTEMNILFLPHVTMPVDNDEDALEEIYKKYERDASKKIRFCWCPKTANAAQRKYLISKCRFLIAARTHATIAAYATGVPALALGYSIKAKGIARDFKMDSFVLEIDVLNTKNQILESFVQLMEQEKEIREKLKFNLEVVKILAMRNFDCLDKMMKERD